MLLAAAIPKIDLVISLVGAVSGTFLVILPNSLMFGICRCILIGIKFFSGAYFSTTTWVSHLCAKYQPTNPYKRNPDPYLRRNRLHYWNLCCHFSNRSRIQQLKRLSRVAHETDSLLLLFWFAHRDMLMHSVFGLYFIPMYF